MSRKHQKVYSQKDPSVALRNRVRGALAILHSKTPAKSATESLKGKRRASAAIQATVAQARAVLTGSELEMFERWVEENSQAQRSHNEIATDEELLGLVPSSLQKSPKLSLALALARSALDRAAHPLVEFAGRLSDINTSIAATNFPEALARVQAVEREYGSSFWSTEARLAILHSMGSGGVAKEQVRNSSIGAVGLNAFYLYHFGLRNEPSQSTSRFRSVVARRLADSDLSPEYKWYAEFRVSKLVPLDSEKLSAILTYEQLTTRTDLLLTAGRVAVQIVANARNFTQAEISAAEELLSCEPIRKAFEFNVKDQRLTLSDDIVAAVRRAVSIPPHATSDKVGELVKVLTSGIASAVSYSGNDLEEELLRKQNLNYWWIPSAIVFDSAGKLPKLPDLYSGTCGFADEEAHPLIKAIVANFDPSFINEKFVKAVNLFTSDSSTRPWEKRTTATEAVNDCLAVKLAWTAYRSDNYASTLRLVQLALTDNPRLLDALPLRAMFAGVEFERIRLYGIGVDLCNCLHWYTVLNSERQIRTYKRFAIEEWIEGTVANGSVLDAANLLVRASAREADFIEFFLSTTCDLATVELLLDVNGTREALAVRSGLLRLAATISKNSSSQLAAEADSIDEQLSVNEVLDALDETMVYVDEEALLPSVSREISPDFERYRLLVSKNDAASTRSSIEELLRSLRQQSATAFQIPVNEADDLLLQMIHTVMHRFIEDPVHGLDAIIGRRIRHGTISDELRGTLEHLHLIGQRPRTGADYDVPSFVAAYLTQFEPNTRRGVNRAFARFSLAIDALVAQLRDEVFQCKQKGKLEPVFGLPVTVLMFAVARDSVMVSGTPEAFVRELFDMFWFQLSSGAERYRPETKATLQRGLREASEKFSADLRAAPLSDVNFLSSVQQASEELQRRAETISGWIRIPKVSYKGRTYHLDLVFDAAVAFCKSKRPGFDPVSDSEIDPSISLDAHAYPIVFDALCIAINNIAQHSGMSNARMKVRVKLSDDRSHLCFEFVSDIAADAWPKEKEARVEAIRNDIASRFVADRARRTTGSGLAKLATIVRQRANCTIEFGALEENRRFRLYFELEYVALESSDERSEG